MAVSKALKKIGPVVRQKSREAGGRKKRDEWPKAKWWTPTRAVLSPQGLLSFGSPSQLLLICLSLAYSNSVNRRGELSSLLRLFLFGMLTRIMNPSGSMPFPLPVMTAECANHWVAKI
ncbi:uncharacterized protein BDV14DRAFT_173791 [Aspergillus stella-maris]|uniref:uncharacterized protein n=1 Tax=Aspergillus stella-maris TaxID=1810926 RepID=UPI003CCD90D4